ncbi:unnamed protein product [Miscanthus lutarioriparius]|uniref:Uncharacterized protein n=1 Tax=Miscanthus lutarioriparius TaxID=422564 RepID=A0A811QNB9_9POAL|nr:unnamed protein product [Miscanthus lutarioriparius]
MSSDQKSDVPGGYFVGHPTNHAAEKTEEPPHAAGEQNPATAQTPGGRFMLCRFNSFIRIMDPDMHTSLLSLLDCCFIDKLNWTHLCYLSECKITSLGVRGAITSSNRKQCRSKPLSRALQASWPNGNPNL